jgi:hypothetical protein
MPGEGPGGTRTWIWLTGLTAWLALAAISCNLLRAPGCLASLTYARARVTTLRRDLIEVAARTATAAVVVWWGSDLVAGQFPGQPTGGRYSVS